MLRRVAQEVLPSSPPGAPRSTRRLSVAGWVATYGKPTRSRSPSLIWPFRRSMCDSQGVDDPSLPMRSAWHGASALQDAAGRALRARCRGVVGTDFARFAPRLCLAMSGQSVIDLCAAPAARRAARLLGAASPRSMPLPTVCAPRENLARVNRRRARRSRARDWQPDEPAPCPARAPCLSTFNHPPHLIFRGSELGRRRSPSRSRASPRAPLR